LEISICSNLHFNFVLTGKRKKKNPGVCIKISSFYYIPHNTFSNSFQHPQVILTHRQLSNARGITVTGGGDENRK
jgi:hypothetical protein